MKLLLITDTKKTSSPNIEIKVKMQFIRQWLMNGNRTVDYIILRLDEDRKSLTIKYCDFVFNLSVFFLLCLVYVKFCFFLLFICFVCFVYWFVFFFFSSFLVFKQVVFRVFGLFLYMFCPSSFFVFFVFFKGFNL